MSRETHRGIRRVASASLTVAVAVFGVTGCSGGAGSADQAGSATIIALHGDYLRADSSSGTIQEIDFIDATHFAMVPVGCTAGGACEEKGTYRSDGTTLSLEDGASGSTTELPLDVLSTFTGAPTALEAVADLVMSSGGSSGLVMGGSTSLVSSTNAQLVTSATRCPSGQTCAGSVQAGDNTLVAMGSPGAQGGAASRGSGSGASGEDDGDDSSGSGSSGGGGRPTYSGPCFPGSDDICTQ